jgi:hypothetical protein
MNSTTPDDKMIMTSRVDISLRTVPNHEGSQWEKVKVILFEQKNPYLVLIMN